MKCLYPPINSQLGPISFTVEVYNDSQLDQYTPIWLLADSGYSLSILLDPTPAPIPKNQLVGSLAHRLDTNIVISSHLNTFIFHPFVKD